MPCNVCMKQNTQCLAWSLDRLHTLHRREAWDTDKQIMANTRDECDYTHTIKHKMAYTIEFKHIILYTIKKAFLKRYQDCNFFNVWCTQQL